MTVYALLVGINKYVSPRVRNLNGCVADVERFETFLRARVKPEDLAEPLILTDEAATRQGIIKGFEYFDKAKNGDTTVFYYSGHGGQDAAPPAFRKIEPDLKNETLICHDSRIDPYTWDLADKELAYLIEAVTKDKPDLHTVVIIDACHSGDITRDQDEEGVRRGPADDRIRPLDSYIFETPPASSRVGDNWYQPPQGKHILLAACRPEEVARERALGEEHQIQGVFSYYLREALKSSGPDLTYRDLFKHVSAMVRLKISSQTPQLETRAENINQKFLGGDVLQPRVTTYGVSYNGTHWVIDGGSIHGIGAPVDEGDRVETTRLAVFPKDQAQIDLSQALGETKVLKVKPTESTITDTLTTSKGEMSQLSQDDTYKAVVIASPLPRLLVQLTGDDQAALDEAQAALETANEGQPSMYIRAAKTEAELEQAELSLVALADEQVYRIRRAHDSLGLFVDTPFSTPLAPQIAIQRLEHMARWIKIYELHNPDSKIKSDDIALTVTSTDFDGQETEVDPTHVINLRYKMIDGQLQKPGFKIEIKNKVSRALYMALVNVAPSYKIWPVALPGASLSTLKVEPNTSIHVAEGNRIALSIPDGLPDTVTEINDLFKLIVSTAPFDAAILEEPSLQIQLRDDGKDIDGFGDRNLLNSLAALLGRIPFRDGGFDEVAMISDWRTIDINVTTTRPQSEVVVTANTKSISLGEGITLTNETNLTGTARLMTDPESGRDVGNLGVPSWLRQNPPHYSEPFALIATRSGEPGLSVLDLSEVENHEDITPDNPLKLKVPVTLADHEQVLPYGFDGEFYLPLGHVTDRTDDGTEITLKQLPDPEGTKSLTNSIRIYFQKIISDKLGLDFEYPRLAVVNYNQETNGVEYEANPEIVKAAIADEGVKNIALYIHGIIGETKYMTPSAWTRIDDWCLADHYDLILAFDYENLETGIKETGVLLRDKLKAVGLGSGHHKTLHIFAHSMAGPISRWMIEHVDGGKEMVQHLFMMGAPNGGSPLPTIQDWVFTALTLGLNGLTIATGWPIGLLSGLLTWFERVDKMLDELADKSPIFEILANSPDPALPYTLIAGNTNLLAQASLPDDSGTSRLERLTQRLNKYRLMDLAFLQQPNDIAVAVESVHRVPDDRNPAPIKRVVSADHMSYFVTEGGLVGLVEEVRKVVDR